jgi:hypothetical protein
LPGAPRPRLHPVPVRTYSEGMAVRNLGKELRSKHLHALSAAERIELNFREARRLNELNPEYAWKRFVAQWRRRMHSNRGEGRADR